MTDSSCALSKPSPILIALRRNRSSHDLRVAPLTVGDLEIDALDHRVRRGARLIKLTPGEHNLLYLLAARAGEVVSHAELAEAMGLDPKVRHNLIARHVRTLRGKLDDEAVRPRYVETVVGAGYRILMTARPVS